MKLRDELKLYGSETTADAFAELLQELHVAMHPAWTYEQLLYYPDFGHRFCETVRARAGQGLPDEMILRRLQNIRKAGEE